MPNRILVTVLALLATACVDEILEVDNPDIIDPGELETPGGLEALRAGAIGDFAFAVDGDAGGTEGQILVSASMADETGNSETFPTRKEYDQRNIDIQNGTLTTVFRQIQRARRSAEQAATTIKALSDDPTRDSRIAETFGLAGFTYIFMAENYCSGVPISEADIDGNLTFGPPLTTSELLDRAIERFDSALANPADTSVTTVERLARIGKARALLNQGDAAGAAALVPATTVPTDFTYTLTHTNAVDRQQNGVFVFINQNERFSVADSDGTNGLAFRSAQDPRIPWRRTGGTLFDNGTDVGFDNSTPQYDQGKYLNEESSVVLAGGVEARLIEAEALLAAGDPGWLGILNTLRADASLYPVPPAGFPSFPALSALADPGTQAGREDLLFQERAFWLYLTGHRLGDLRRLVRQYGRDPDAVFPGGGGLPYIVNGNNKGGNFGNDYNLPIPFDEENNPNFSACLDRNP